ncbi:MAG: glycoside hydrolase family 32 protein [Hungatella sp.]|nr:glycoside hydrolase family 32 protein [Hungatella sp.]
MDKSVNAQLLKVRRMEKKQIHDIPKEERPAYHMSSPTGWINDPNGFSVFQGQYHLFFQYHPFSKKWGPMHWGHCTSEDFIKWEYLPCALAPEESYDEGGCYSGSAIEVDGEHVLIYTGIMDRYLDDGFHYYRQVQCIAKGNGIDYRKGEENPIITGESLPEGSSLEDFRDPKVWREDDGYYLVVGSRAKDGSGQILMYYSEDLNQWEYVTVLEQSKNKYGKMWECPDFFSLGDRQILLVSPQDMRAKGLEFHNGNNSIFIYGQYEKESHQFKREKVTSADYGLDFYAAQTLLTQDGRRILIGWMQSWDANITPASFQWSGMMTIPRELTLEHGRIYQRPVRELEKYRTDMVRYDNLSITGSTILKNITGRVLELLVEITGFDFEYFRIQFAKSDEYQTFLQYNHKKRCLTIDRTHSGIDRDVVCRRKMELAPIQEENSKEVLKLRILLDKYSVEVFANDGEKVMSSLFYTPLEAESIVFDSDGTACINIIKYSFGNLQ